MEFDISRIVDWMRYKVEKANSDGVVLGVSGGIDSSVLAAIAKKAFGDNVLGLKLPCESSMEDELHADLLAKAIDLRTEKVDLTNIYRNLINVSFDSKHSLAKANIKPRLRMTMLYYYAQSLNYLVIGASNKSEYEIGYFTKYGDSGVDLLPLIEYQKFEIYEMAKCLNIPQIIINKAPSAGLYEGHIDEDELGFSYELLDRYLSGGLIDLSTQMRIGHMQKTTEHKRRFPDSFKR